MKVKFRTYCGLAGDLQEILYGENEEGLEVSRLIPRTGIFRYWRMQRAKKAILKELELMTGQKHYEKL